jgi:hypothetical protein
MSGLKRGRGPDGDAVAVEFDQRVVGLLRRERVIGVQTDVLHQLIANACIEKHRVLRLIRKDSA